MNVLILINAAPAHRPFYSRVGRELKRRGHQVVYAVDSHYTDVMYPEAPLDGSVHYFSDYFRTHASSGRVPSALRDENLWLAMLPDFDRLNHSAAHHSATWRRRPGYYADLPGTLASFFWELFETYKFDRVVYEVVSNAFSYVAFLVARVHGAVYLGFAGSRLPSRIEASTTQYHEDARFASTYLALRERRRTVSDEVRREVQSYLSTFRVTSPDWVDPKYLGPSNPLERYSRAESLLRVARSLRYQLSNSADLEYASQIPYPAQLYPSYLSWDVRRFFRVKYLSRGTYRVPDPAGKYFVYPMQFQPESSISVNAPFYSDELSMIRNVAASLPFGTSLYVKDHKSQMAGRQTLDFYSEVSRMPNVVLVHPAVDAKMLVANSMGVTTRTSTMGYEAIVLGKPVFVFGRPFYRFHPMCVQLSSFDDLFPALRRAESFHCDAADIFDFVSAYYLCTYPGNYNLPVSHADPTLVATVSGMIEHPPLRDPEGTVPNEIDSGAARAS